MKGYLFFLLILRASAGKLYGFYFNDTESVNPESFILFCQLMSWDQLHPLGENNQVVELEMCCTLFKESRPRMSVLIVNWTKLRLPYKQNRNVANGYRTNKSDPFIKSKESPYVLQLMWAWETFALNMPNGKNIFDLLAVSRNFTALEYDETQKLVGSIARSRCSGKLPMVRNYFGKYDHDENGDMMFAYDYFNLRPQTILSVLRHAFPVSSSAFLLFVNSIVLLVVVLQAPDDSILFVLRFGTLNA